MIFQFLWELHDKEQYDPLCKFRLVSKQYPRDISELAKLWSMMYSAIFKLFKYLLTFGLLRL